jgi:hypothetical protein
MPKKESSIHLAPALLTALQDHGGKEIFGISKL